MYMGRRSDLFEAFKKQYNFEKKRMLYVLEDNERVSLLDL